MFRASQWSGSPVPQPEPPRPLPFALYGSLEAEMIERMRQKVTPLDDYLIDRVVKANILEVG